MNVPKLDDARMDGEITTCWVFWRLIHESSFWVEVGQLRDLRNANHSIVFTTFFLLYSREDQARIPNHSIAQTPGIRISDRSITPEPFPWPKAETMKLANWQIAWKRCYMVVFKGYTYGIKKAQCCVAVQHGCVIVIHVGTVQEYAWKSLAA